MPLIQCPDCGREVSDLAPTCIGCGRPLAPSRPVGSQSRVQGEAAPDSTWRCPKCGGSDFKKLSLLYEEHRSTSRSRTRGAGVGLSGKGIGLGLGGASSQGTSLTELGKRIAPPDEEAMAQESASAGATLGMLVGALPAYFTYQAVGFLWAIGVFFASVFLIGLIVMLMTSSGIDARHRSALRRWNHSYLCLRCGRAALMGGDGQVIGGEAQVDALLRHGRKIQAIKLIQERSGLGLAEAKDRAEARARELGV